MVDTAGLTGTDRGTRTMGVFIVDEEELVRRGPVDLLTSFDDEALLAAVLAGAAGYLVKQITGSSLVDGV